MYDVIIIGGGPGGYTAALEAKKLDKKVLLIERDNLGGVCLNEGCIPTKALLHCGKLYKKSSNSSHLGLDIQNNGFNWSKALDWKNRSVIEIRDSLTNLLKDIEIIRGDAKIIDPKTIEVNGEMFYTENILIATGSKSSKPPISGLNSSYVYFSRDILNLEVLPKSITIIGGGVIGIEFASLFHSVGVDVTVIEMEKNLLPGLDERLSKGLKKALNFTIQLGAKVREIVDNRVSFEDRTGDHSVESDIILIATGRTPNGKQFSDLGITDGFKVLIDDNCRTPLENIYAIGDVTGKSFLAHGSEKMAHLAISNMFGEEQIMNYDLIPSIVYSEPEIASVGYTVKKCKELGIKVKKSTIQLKSNGRYRVEDGDDSGICMVITEESSGKILGVHLLGSHVSEIIAVACVAIEAGLTKDQFRAVNFPHPTLSESIKDTLFNLV